MNRLKNSFILLILIIFLWIVAKIPVTCVFKTVTGISCASCGMTRAFLSILHFDFLDAIYQNILSIPFFIFLIVSICILFYEILRNQFNYIPKILNFLGKHFIAILLLLFISFLFNLLKSF